MAITQKLRPYQVEIGRAVFDSIYNRKGLTFTVEIARQGGKNELSAQIELLLLTLYMKKGGNAIKCSPTFKPQAMTSILRLEERLAAAGYFTLWSREHGNMVRVGKARQIFLSADGSSHVVGATAQLLLEVDECQDVSEQKFNKEFRPMAASTNATTVLWGTTWDDNTLLEKTKKVNQEMEKMDGIKRHFRFDWEHVARYNPDYRRFVLGERERLGEQHPLFQTQYCLNPVGESGLLFNREQKLQLRGNHPRRQRCSSGCVYVAGIDLAGGFEQQNEPGYLHSQYRGNSTVVTIGELDLFDCNKLMSGGPRINIVDHYYWTGKPHNMLYPELVDILRNVWKCRSVVVDATGIGYGVANFLREALGIGTVTPFLFTESSKSRIGFELLAAVNSRRLKMYGDDGSEECREFWKQVGLARSFYRPNQTMNFHVAASDGHDDFLMSLSLLVEAASHYKLRTARGHINELSS